MRDWFALAAFFFGDKAYAMGHCSAALTAMSTEHGFTEAGSERIRSPSAEPLENWRRFGVNGSTACAPGPRCLDREVNSPELNEEVPDGTI